MRGVLCDDKKTAINAVCPYYTMFPLALPLRHLRRNKTTKSVLDPFCGRGTTILAARAFGAAAHGIDTSPVAVAISEAKLACANIGSVMHCLDSILRCGKSSEVPESEFWECAYNVNTLRDLCTVRDALNERCDIASRILLRAFLLGALHGPMAKTPSYLSNQSPRTFAPKPQYAVRFWRERRLEPPKVSLRDVVLVRARRYLSQQLPVVDGCVLKGDARDSDSYPPGKTFDCVITSPPYYGMRTYIPDQWLRNWFLGGPAEVDYSQAPGEIQHKSVTCFGDELSKVWKVCASKCRPGAKLMVRFGAFNSKTQEPRDVIKASLKGTGWRIETIVSAGTASNGRRQADHFGRTRGPGVAEFDVYACLD